MMQYYNCEIENLKSVVNEVRKYIQKEKNNTDGGDFFQPQ